MQLKDKSTGTRDALMLGAAGIVAASVIGGCTQTVGKPGEPEHTAGRVTFTFNDIPGTGNTKVLNYALFLETLEAELYRQCLVRLTGGGDDNRGNKIAGLGLGMDEPDVRFVKMFKTVEDQHRVLLQTALSAFQGFQAVKPSKYDFGVALADRRQVMETLYGVERTGAQAYLGAIKYFPDKTYIRIAAAIQGTEARHYAAIAEVNNLLFHSQNSVAPLATENHGIETPQEPDMVLAAVSKYIVER
jgi:hypothetical protein